MASSSQSTWETFQIIFSEISFAATYTSHQRIHTNLIFKQACKMLTDLLRREINVLRFWSNISDGIFSELTSTMTETEILSRITQEPTHTEPMKLAEMIARLTIYIPHPDENISKFRFDFETEYASTYQDNDASTTIYIHPNVFDLNVITTGNS
jgi:hypothetical protein